MPKTYPLTPKDAALLKHGPKCDGVVKSLRAQRGYNDEDIRGTRGLVHQVNYQVTSYLITKMKQQLWTKEHTYRVCMLPNNMGTLWLRRANDPEKAFNKIWAWSNPWGAPVPPMRHTHEKFKQATANGETYTQSALHKIGENPDERRTRTMLKELLDAGALEDARDAGTAKNHQIYRAVPDMVYEEVCRKIRRGVAAKCIRAALQMRVLLEAKKANAQTRNNTICDSIQRVPMPDDIIIGNTSNDLDNRQNTKDWLLKLLEVG